MRVGPIACYLSLLLISTPAFACKERKHLPEFPVNEVGTNQLALIRVTSATSRVDHDTKYTPPLDFEAEVIEVFVGDLTPGETLLGQTGNEESAAAVCPVTLKEGVEYLVILESGEKFHISRFSYRSIETDPSHESYLNQLRERFGDSGP